MTWKRRHRHPQPRPGASALFFSRPEADNRLSRAVPSCRTNRMWHTTYVAVGMLVGMGVLVHALKRGSGWAIGGSPGGSAAGGRGGTAGSGGGGSSPSGGTGGLPSTLGWAEAVETKGPSVPDDCADSAKVIYLVTQENYLYSFDPRIDGTSAYNRIGTLSCETASTPQSMSVDRTGKAYVFYSSGHLYFVSTTTAQCTPTTYQHPVSPAKSSYQLGMGFTAKAPSSNEQVLYINSPDFGLATVDLQTLAPPSSTYCSRLWRS
jgi:hypothetical protein